MELLTVNSTGEEDFNHFLEENKELLISTYLCVFVRFLSQCYGHSSCTHTHTCTPYMQYCNCFNCILSFFTNYCLGGSCLIAMEASSTALDNIITLQDNMWVWPYQPF